MSSGWRQILFRLPVVALLVGAANHFWLVRHDELSPWLGGGFGMFSTSDVGSARRVVVTAVTRDGQEHPVTLGEPLQEPMRRARGLPDRKRLEALAQAVRDALASESSDVDVTGLAALTIEVWGTRFDPETLQPRQFQLARERFELGVSDG